MNHYVKPSFNRVFILINISSHYHEQEPPITWPLNYGEERNIMVLLLICGKDDKKQVILDNQ